MVKTMDSWAEERGCVYPHIRKVDGIFSGRRPCIDGTRVRVLDIVFPEKEGYTPDRMLEQYPDLNRSTPTIPSSTSCSGSVIFRHPVSFNVDLAIFVEYPAKASDALADLRNARPPVAQDEAATRGLAQVTG